MNIMGIQETNLTEAAARGLFLLEGSDNKFTDNHKHYTIFWSHGQRRTAGRNGTSGYRSRADRGQAVDKTRNKEDHIRR